MMNKIRNKRVTIFGKTISAILLALLLIGGIASAGLLTYYGRIVTTVNVHQSIKLWDGIKWMECTPGYGDCTISDTILETSPGGEKFCFKHKLENQMSVEGDIGFETKYSPDGEGITTTYYNIPMETTLVLENKDAGWKVIIDDRKATLTFDTVGNDGKFNYELVVNKLTPSTEYTIIYYADFEPRFEKWGGNNPGAVIDTFTTDGSGNYNSGSKSVDIGMNLPGEPDWNINPSPDYCDLHNTFDDYEHCKGAKIWIVPTSDLTGGVLPLKAWNPGNYLFETDLIAYLDCDESVEPYFQDFFGDPIMDLIIPSKEVQDFLVCYKFAENIKPGTYTIATNVLPA